MSNVVVAYPWHPLHGKKLRFIWKSGRFQEPQFCVEVREGLCRDLPAWMFDLSLYAGMIVGAPQWNLAVLQKLRTILDARNRCSAGSWKRPQKESISDEPNNEGRTQLHSGIAGVPSRLAHIALSCSTLSQVRDELEVNQGLLGQPFADRQWRCPAGFD